MEETIYHYGIKGMKWGIRRFQNKDGSLTKAGKTRYDSNDSDVTKKVKKDYNNLSSEQFKSKYYVSKETYKKKSR